VAGSHIFICFSSKDESVAREVVTALENNGLKCWISLRDVLPGQNYQEAIVSAIEAASGIVFLFSENSSRSGEIKKELSIGGSINVPVFPLRLAPIAPSGALRYELAIRQWIDIFPHREHALVRLANTIKTVLDAPPDAADEVPLAPAAKAPAARAAKAAKARAKRTAPIVQPGSQQFEAIRALLARHIGPIAKILVEKASAEAVSADDFCERLASRISAPNDRATFVQAVRSRLAEKA
jgi:hypothetical protein